MKQETQSTIGGREGRAITCCIAARYDEGILLASDSCLSLEEHRISTESIKTIPWCGVPVLYAGDLGYIQKLFTAPIGWKDCSSVELLQKHIWDNPPAADDTAEFLTVEFNQMYILTDRGERTSHTDYAVIGSEYGWLGMDLVYPDIRKRTLYATKKNVARVLRAVERRDRTVYRPFYFCAIE